MALYESQPANSEELAGCEAYDLDNTPKPEEVGRTGGNGSADRVLASGWHATLQTADVAALDGSRHNPLTGPLSDVSLTVCDRALFRVLQTEPGLERQSVSEPDQPRPMDVGYPLWIKSKLRAQS